MGVSETTKFCKDCKFCKRSVSDILLLFGTYRFAKCMHPRFGTDSEYYIAGKKVDDGKYCSGERNDAYRVLGVCGSEAKYFEKK